MTSIRKLAFPAVFAIALSVASAGHAATTPVSPPYSAGQMCYTYFFPNGGYNYGYFCHNDPPPYGYVPNQYDTGAPFNAVATSARNGQLAVGGWETVGTTYVADVYKASSIVKFSGPTAVGNVSATADITGFNVSSPFVNRFQVCLEIWDVTYGYYAYSPLAKDCFNKTVPFRNLAATALNVAANRALKVEVLLRNTAENGGARATVSNITYTLP